MVVVPKPLDCRNSGHYMLHSRNKFIYFWLFQHFSPLMLTEMKWHGLLWKVKTNI